MKDAVIRIQLEASFCRSTKIDLLSRQFWRSVYCINNRSLWKRLIEYVSWHRLSRTFHAPWRSGYFIVIQKNDAVEASVNWRGFSAKYLNTIVDTMTWYISPDEIQVSVASDDEVAEITAFMSQLIESGAYKPY